ncbi:MAG TPA: trehalose-phosphatase [Candidatus Limnocylindria bacterium]|nr:trehalose-phosphatase [Candidatus Limnocylindria bacterium]
MTESSRRPTPSPTGSPTGQPTASPLAPPSASLSEALELARDVLSARPAGVLTDFDGTLSPIVTDPALARLVEGGHGALARLAEQLEVVAIITGRAALDARRMTGVPGLLIAGNHGTEWLEPTADEPVAAPGMEDVRSRLDRALARLPELEGVPIEHKGLSAAIHYRNAPDPAATRRAILDGLGDVGGEGLELRHGRMTVELRAIGAADKGTATRALVERHALRAVVVLGDDVTDLDMFRAVIALRAEGRVRGLVVGVGGGDHEVPEEVRGAADVLLRDPAEAAAFLEGLTRV